MSKVFLSIGAVLGSGLAFAAVAPAAVSYSTGATTNFTVAAGTEATVPIYVRQTASEISGDGGLYSSGFLVTHTGAADDATVDLVTPNTAVFDSLDPASSYSDTTAGVYQTQDQVSTPGMPTGGLLLLGTLSIDASAVSGTVSHYSIGDFDPATTQTLTYNFTELDASILAGTFTVTAAATPEPTTLGALGLAAALASRRARRR